MPSWYILGSYPREGRQPDHHVRSVSNVAHRRPADNAGTRKSLGYPPNIVNHCLTAQHCDGRGNKKATTETRLQKRGFGSTRSLSADIKRLAAVALVGAANSQIRYFPASTVIRSGPTTRHLMRFHTIRLDEVRIPWPTAPQRTALVGLQELSTRHCTDHFNTTSKRFPPSFLKSREGAGLSEQAEVLNVRSLQLSMCIFLPFEHSCSSWGTGGRLPPQAR